MSEWEVSNPLDYSPNGDDIDSASQKIIAEYENIYLLLNRLRTLNSGAGSSVGDVIPYEFKIDTSTNPASFLVRNADNTEWIRIGGIGENFGITAKSIGAIPNDGGMGNMKQGRDGSKPATANNYDIYFASDSKKIYMWQSGAWTLFTSLNYDDLINKPTEFLTWGDTSTGEPDKIVKTDENNYANINISGSADKVGGKKVVSEGLRDGQILVWRDSEDAYVNEDMGGGGGLEPLIINVSDGNRYEYDGSRRVEANIRTGGGSGGAILQQITIPTNGWKANTGTYLYYVDVNNGMVTEGTSPMVAIHVEYIDKANECGLCPTCEAFDGYLRFYAKKIPTSAIQTTVTLIPIG